MIGRDARVGPREPGLDSERRFVRELHGSLKEVDGKGFVRFGRDPTPEARVSVSESVDASHNAASRRSVRRSGSLKEG